MPEQHLSEPLRAGTWVKILNSGFDRARVVEFMGNLGPKGARVYRVQYRGKPKPGYTHVLEEQLEILKAPK